MKLVIKNITKKVTVIALATAVMFSGFAFVNTAEAARKGYDPKKVGGTLTYATFSDAQRLTPYTTNDSVSNSIQGFIFDGLLTRDAKLNPLPSLASSWKVSANGLEYTFNLRKDVKWHDGKPFTADDVVFTFNIYTDPKSLNAYRESFADIEKVEKIDNYTVKMTLNKNNVLFMSATPVTAAILPKHQFPKGVEDFNSNTQIHRNPIGTGPFKFDSWKTAERIVLKANKDYFEGRPYLDEIIMRVLPDSNVEVINLQKGTVDFVESIPPKQAINLAKNKKLKLDKHDTARYDYIGWNMDNPKFKDVKVRQALAMGLNRQAIVDKIMVKNATLAVSNFHPLEIYHNPTLKPMPYDVKKANALLDEAGWKLNKEGIREKDGVKLEFEISWNNGNLTRKSIAEAAAQDWKKLGVKATPRSIDFTIQGDRNQEGKLETWVGAWLLGTNPDKTGLFHSGSAPVVDNSGKVTQKGNNTSRVRDKRVDEIFEKFKLEPDAKKRVAMYQELAKIMNENQYNLFLYHPATYSGMNAKLSGMEITLYSTWFNIIDWYWAK